MKQSLFLLFSLLPLPVWSQLKELNEISLPQKALPYALCVDKMPQQDAFIVCADGKILQMLGFRAHFKNQRLFIGGSKPQEDRMFPMVQLFVASDGKPGTYESKKGEPYIYGTFRDGGSESFNSQMHNGSCRVDILEFTEEKISGTFGITAYDQWGNDAKLVSGVFNIKFKKE